MTPAMELVVALVGILFVAGGPLAIFVNAKASQKPEMTTAEAEVTTVLQITEELGIDSRYRKYSDDLEHRLAEQDERFNRRIEKLEKDLKKTRRSVDKLALYAVELRMHIAQQLPPPAPPWPEDIE